ncbi:hypothetical protein BU14_0672s0010 [Porphyra umbilicalis]|uniref:CMP/dCMP-type deaminase domain-containing protein n=1 Tax=Porphyra umbilicalis TaxID=2786 RepID=A0A1X6NQ51_PORUM|nr:hypothetical protein BU14_0672s0010 [Porphyra umbilicalis]|eukprot:OSX70769.1 hypothetical protein BU14_0672s0010 [Porphyra umbilicalis]
MVSQSKPPSPQPTASFVPSSSHSDATTTAAAAAAAAAVDARWMRRAVALARRAVGRTRPNPPVGCVILPAPTADAPVPTVPAGEGYHPLAGLRHAEAGALAAAAAAGRPVAGGTAYVTLEPCAHTGRTPPCADALVAAAVARVVVGVLDVDSRVAGRGVARLRAAGVGVDVWDGEEGTAELVAPFFWWKRSGRPYGVLKYAMTLDGRIATDGGDSRWVSGATSRGVVQRLRGGVDAIVVGGNTLRLDDPQLTLREAPGRGVGDPLLGGERPRVPAAAAVADGAAAAAAEEAWLAAPLGAGAQPEAGINDHVRPLRVVVTRNVASLPPAARAFSTPPATVVYTTPDGAASAAAAALIDGGVEVVGLDPLDAGTVADALGERGIMVALWECGGGLAGGAMAAGVVQRVVAFVAPKVVGGGVYGPVGPFGVDAMGGALPLQDVRVERIGDDIMVVGEVGATEPGKGPSG